MTLRSRLSAAWKAFIRDDFPPTVANVTSSNLILDSSAYPVKLGLTYGKARIKSEAEYAEEMRAVSRPSMADECEAIRREQDAVDMSPHPLPSAVDERSALAPDNANVELVKAPGIRRRKKLASVPKE